ncbi:hypothetical protein DOTSEDRAFT_169535 [Dothistroma septosporum NZE10]|uniref:Rhodopsin domain-containing protein n=1 Tax=Dothistroma septosporum (strain NZE10 / CBS 128990) TaxID=675120 RepID=N1PUV8_DOTSN|nr:hypothetical protein DOTSEDRAFT_169535 [Dothistroma septosporum NZE10]
MAPASNAFDDHLSQLPEGPRDTWPSDDRGPSIQAIQILMIVFATSAVALRFTARRVSSFGLWWDDWTILAALGPCLAINVANIIGVSLGLGRHIWDVHDSGKAYLRTLFVTEITYTTALALNKLAVLLMYHRLFEVERKMKIAVKVLAVIVISWWMAVEITTLLQCTPIHRFWNYEKKGTCIDIAKFFEGSAIPNVIIDIAILLLPQPIIWRLKLSKTNKIALCGIFLLGALTSVSSIGRLVAIIKYNNGIDFTFKAFDAIVWYSLEPTVGILCACLPCLGPLLRKLPGSPFASHWSNSASRPPSKNLSCQFIQRGHRHLDLDTASVTKLTTQYSIETAICAPTSDVMDDFIYHLDMQGSHEMNAIRVRSAIYTHSPTSP